MDGGVFHVKHVQASSTSFASPDWAKLSRSAASPFPNVTTLLGSVGGLRELEASSTSFASPA